MNLPLIVSPGIKRIKEELTKLRISMNRLYYGGHSMGGSTI